MLDIRPADICSPVTPPGASRPSSRPLRVLRPALLLALLVSGCPRPARAPAVIARQPPPTPEFCARQLKQQNPKLLAINSGPPLGVSFDSGLLLVRYDGCHLETLPQSACKAAGRYRFVPETPRAQGENHLLESRAELSAQAPLLGLQIGAGLGMREAVGVAVSETGFWEGDQPIVSRDRLEGDPECIASATHFVRMVSVGAYVAIRGESEEIHARIGTPFFGAKGGASEAHSVFTSAGDIRACFEGPEALCRAPVRLVLSPIAEQFTVQCPAGQAPGEGGRCSEPIDPDAHVYQLSIGAKGPACNDLVGDCDYEAEVWIGNSRALPKLIGPQDSRLWEPQLAGRFTAPELLQGVTVKLWDRDPVESDWLGECTITVHRDTLAGHLKRRKAGAPAEVESLPCGGRTLLYKIEPNPGS